MSEKKRKPGAQPGNKHAVGNRGGARPSKYRKEFAEQAYKLGLLGATDRQLADFFQVSETALNDWKKKHDEFSLAIERGKTPADAQVAESLFRRATGYKHRAVKIFPKMIPDPETGELKPLKVPYVEHYPPDVQAATFWLRNRVKEVWKDKPELDFSKLTEEQLDQIIERIKKLNDEPKGKD